MSLAKRYYAQERSLFRRESQWKFKSPAEAIQAIEYVCRRWGVTPVMVQMESATQGITGGVYHPHQWVLAMKQAKIVLFENELNLTIIAHEIAHHLDAEEMIAQNKWIRGFPMPGHRWHRKHHRELMRLVIDVIRQKYGIRPLPSCAKSRPAVKVRS